MLNEVRLSRSDASVGKGDEEVRADCSAAL